MRQTSRALSCPLSLHDVICWMFGNAMFVEQGEGIWRGVRGLWTVDGGR